MKSDGQLYSSKPCGSVTPPPFLLQQSEECDVPPTPCKEKTSPVSEELLIVGLLLLIGTDKCKHDIPLVLALVYVLLFK